MDLETVTDAQVKSNRGDSTDADGIPPGKIHAVVEGGTDAEIAAVIYSHTAGGIGWHGGVSVNYVSPVQGITEPVKFSRPAYKSMRVEITIRKNKDFGVFPPDGAAQIKQAVLAYYAGLKSGGDVSRSKISKAAETVPGHAVQSVKLGVNPIAVDADFLVRFGEKAQTIEAQIIVGGA
jgi:uncharacterized phage protein gp47/JayE